MLYWMSMINDVILDIHDKWCYVILDVHDSWGTKQVQAFFATNFMQTLTIFKSEQNALAHNLYM